MPDDETKTEEKKPAEKKPAASSSTTKRPTKRRAPRKRRSTARAKRPPAKQEKPTTRRDGVEKLDNVDDPLAGDMHAHLRDEPEGAVDFYDNPPDAASSDEG